MKTYYANCAALRLIQIMFLAVTVLLCIAAGVLAPSLIVMWIFIGIFAGIYGILCWLYLPLYFRKLIFYVTPCQITVKRGVFLRQEQSVRLQTVQFVRLVTGPCAGAAGQNYLILYVYGGSLFLPFLARRDRMEIMELLRKKGVYHAP